MKTLQTAFQHHQAGRLHLAEKMYRQVLRVDPRQAKAYLLLGLLSYQDGRNEQAVEYIQKAISLDSTDPVYFSSLGSIYRGLGWLEPAIASYRRALALNPRDAADHYDLGITYSRLEQLDEAANCFRRALSLSPDQVLWQLELDGLCPSIMPDTATIKNWRARFNQALDQYPPGSIDLTRSLPEILHANIYPPFNLPYHGEDDLPFKVKYAGLFSFDEQAVVTAPSPSHNGRYRVGFLVTRNHERIFLSLVGGLLNQMTDPTMEITVICPAASADIIRAIITNKRVNILTISEELPLALSTLKTENFDLIYYWEVGSDPLNYFLPFFRPAPVQCTSWGLSSTTGIPQMDYFISSELLEDNGAEAHYSEQLIKFKTLPTYFYRPALPELLKTRSDLGFSDDDHIYFCPQNLLKFHPDFDWILGEILRRDPLGKLLLINTKVPHWQKALLRRFQTTIPDVFDRIQVLPKQGFTDFINLIALADVMLDTIHYSGGNTTHEALALGTPIVTLPSKYLRGRLTLGRYKKIGVMDCVAATPQEYVDLAVRLGTDPAYRATIKVKIMAANDVLYEDAAAVREFEQFFKQAIDSARTGQPLTTEKLPTGQAAREVSPESQPPRLNGGLTSSTAGEKIEHRRVELAFDGQSAPTSWPTVSLCMIVKNEENSLAACLESVGDFASEIIIVDTGSTDGTVELARSLGARVEHFTWIDDFAAARNEAIKYAGGEWIFYIDGDDRISPDNLVRLKQALVSNKADVYICSVTSRNAQHDRARANVIHPRLFRNHLGLQFEYPLHEKLTVAAVPRPLTVAFTNIIIEHFGYIIDKDAFVAKARRNLGIVQQCLARNPDSPRWRYYLGVSLSILGDYAGAREAFEYVIGQPVTDDLNEADLSHAHLSLASIYVKMNQPEQADRVMQRALNQFPQRYHLAIAAGMFYLDRDDPQTALTWLTRAKNLPIETFSTEGQVWLPGTIEEYLGLTYYSLAEPVRAQAAYQAMLAESGLDRQVLSSSLRHQAQALLAAEAYDSLVDLLEPVADGNPEALRLLTQAERHCHRWEKSVRYLAQAIGLSEAGPGEWIELATAFILKTGKTTAAKQLCRLALTENSHDEPAQNLLRMIEKSPQNFWQTVADLVDKILTGANSRSALTRLEQLADLFGLPPVEILRYHGQRLISQKDYHPASEAFALIVELAPTNAAAYKSLGVALNSLGHQEEALVAWQMGRQLEPAAASG